MKVAVTIQLFVVILYVSFKQKQITTNEFYTSKL